MVEYNNGRKVVFVKELTIFGQELVARAMCNIGFDLSDVYTRFSKEKQLAYEGCWSMYCNDASAHDFRICSRNSNVFTVAWDTPEEIIYLTAYKEYHIVKAGA